MFINYFNTKIYMHTINILNFWTKKLRLNKNFKITHNHVAHKWLGGYLKSFQFDSWIQAFDYYFVSYKAK